MRFSVSSHDSHPLQFTPKKEAEIVGMPVMYSVRVSSNCYSSSRSSHYTLHHWDPFTGGLYNSKVIYHYVIWYTHCSCPPNKEAEGTVSV